MTNIIGISEHESQRLLKFFDFENKNNILYGKFLEFMNDPTSIDNFPVKD